MCFFLFFLKHLPDTRLHFFQMFGPPQSRDVTLQVWLWFSGELLLGPNPLTFLPLAHLLCKLAVFFISVEIKEESGTFAERFFEVRAAFSGSVHELGSDGLRAVHGEGRRRLAPALSPLWQTSSQALIPLPLWLISSLIRLHRKGGRMKESIQEEDVKNV